MKLRKSLVAIVVLLSLVIAACGGTPGSTTPSGSAGASAALSGDIRISGWSSSPTEDALLQDSINTFMAANPNVKVKWEPIAQDYETVLKTNLAAGTEADVFYADIFWIDSLMKTGKLLALDDLMAKSGVKKDDFVPTLINAFSYQGKTYGIPKDFNTLGLVYNKDIFKAAGVAEPTNDWTWNDLSAAAQTTNPDAAWALANYLTGTGNQTQVLKAGFALPTRQALSSQITNPNSKAIFDGAPYGKPFNYASANTGKVNDEINKALESIMLKKSSTKDALDKLATTIKPLLQ